MLKQRIITALILAPLAVWGVFGLNTAAFSWFIGAIVVLAAWEWADLSNLTSQPARIAYAAVIGVLLYLVSDMRPGIILALAVLWWVWALMLVMMYPNRARIWQSAGMRALMGILILVPTWVGLVRLHGSQLVGASLSGSWIILYVFCVVWAADIGAYFAGRAWGNKKLAPNVSPGKSWAGVYGGWVAVTLLAVVVGLALDASPAKIMSLVGLTLLTAWISVVGDLCESMVKRIRGVKDSSQLLPGHGGILDRVDSITAAVPVFTVLASALSWVA